MQDLVLELAQLLNDSLTLGLSLGVFVPANGTVNIVDGAGLQIVSAVSSLVLICSFGCNRNHLTRMTGHRSRAEVLANERGSLVTAFPVRH